MDGALAAFLVEYTQRTNTHLFDEGAGAAPVSYAR